MSNKPKITPAAGDLFQVPKTIEVGGMTVSIVEDKNLYDSHGAFGMMDMDRGKLLLATGLEGDLQGITYYHEVFHMILNTLGKTELNENEEFVDGVANLLWQAIKTAKY